MFKLFSVDDHIVEPPGVWVDRVPAAYKGRVPHIICESDYPHSDTTFPNTQNVLKGLFEGVPADEVEMMTHRNAEELFRFPMTVPEGFKLP